MNLIDLLKRLGGECKFANLCKENGQYNSQNITCIQTRGRYYSEGDFAGCYVRLENELDRQEKSCCEKYSK